ncbi:MAG TPA: hypothetical protein HPQ00_15585, partial [Magnetococcales bacterium]|nr:hypothetical protein [Magnetococcales bacterium]
MNYFLDREWLALMEQTSSISRACRLEVEGQTVWVGEYQNARQKKWQLFGAWEKDGAPWLEALFALGDRHGVFQIECAFNMARWTDKEMLEGLGAEITEEFGTYAVDLGLEPETLWSGLHGKHRNMIQRARRENLRVFFDVDAEALAATMDETYAKGGVDNPFSRSYLRHLLALAGPKMLLAG